MQLNGRLKQLSRVLDKRSVIRLKNAAEKAQKLEVKWQKKLDRKYAKIEANIVKYIRNYGRLPPISAIDFTDFYVEHSFEVMKTGMEMAMTEEQTKKPPKRLAKKPTKRPKSFDQLLKLWDKWRKKQYVPKRQKNHANNIAKQYLKKVQSVWRKHSEEFRDGNEFTQESVLEKIKKAGRTTQARAKTIVNTETTRYYNKSRRQIYDESPDVKYYLFVAVRDAATTKWCKTRQGIVYKKGDPVLDKETPPIHWNCRSELLPLTPLNPAHKKLIEDRGRWRKNRHPASLPPGWNKRVA